MAVEQVDELVGGEGGFLDFAFLEGRLDLCSQILECRVDFVLLLQLLACKAALLLLQPAIYLGPVLREYLQQRLLLCLHNVLEPPLLGGDAVVEVAADASREAPGAGAGMRPARGRAVAAPPRGRPLSPSGAMGPGSADGTLTRRRTGPCMGQIGSAPARATRSRSAANLVPQVLPAVHTWKEFFLSIGITLQEMFVKNFRVTIRRTDKIIAPVL